MGLGGISIWQLLIILVIVLLLFGTKKLRGLGSDLGGAIKGFKESMGDKEEDTNAEAIDQKSAQQGEQQNETAEAKTAEETEKTGA